MKQRVALIAATLLLLITGLRVYLAFQAPYPFTDKQVVETVTHIAIEPELKNKSQRFIIILENKRLQVTTGNFPRYNYNDLIKLSGTIAVRRSKSGELVATSKYPHITLVTETNPLYLATGFIRSRAIRTFERTLGICTYR